MGLTSILLVVGILGIAFATIFVTENTYRKQVYVLQKTSADEVVIIVEDKDYDFAATIHFDSKKELMDKLLIIRANAETAIEVGQPMILTNCINYAQQPIPVWALHKIINQIDIITTYPRIHAAKNAADVDDDKSRFEVFTNDEWRIVHEKGIIESGGASKAIYFNDDFLTSLDADSKIPGASSGTGTLLIYDSNGFAKKVFVLRAGINIREIKNGDVVKMWRFASAQELLVKCSRACRRLERTT